jgi:hypothetical protein
MIRLMARIATRAAMTASTIQSGASARAGGLLLFAFLVVDTTPETTKAVLRRPIRNSLTYLREFGAGEGIRTLDPNLGKVVLYP